MGSVFHRINGRGKTVYYISYYVQGTRKKERIGLSKKEANEALQSRMTDIRRQKFDGIIPEPNYTLEQVKDQYFRYSKSVKSEMTCQRDKGIVTRHLIPHFGKTALHQITVEQVEDYRSKRVVLGIAPATINKEVQLLKNIVKKAIEWGKMRTNRISGVKPLKTPPGLVRYLGLEQVPKLMKACPDWLKPIVMINMNTGLRRGEVVNLQRKNIDKKNRLITVEITKNNERKTVPMNKTVFEVIKSLPARLDTPYLFADERGEPVSGNKVSMAFRRACKNAGIDDFRLHDLRHHFASYLTMAGENLQTVQELMGHKDPKMTMRYAHLSSEHKQRAVERLDDLILESNR